MEIRMNDEEKQLPKFEITRYQNLAPILKVFFLILTVSGVSIVIYYLFGFRFLGVPIDAAYYYLLMAFYLPSVFLIIPASKKDKRVPWYDVLLSILTFGIALYFVFHAWDIRTVGWVPTTPFNFLLSVIFFFLVIEGGRRGGGFIYSMVTLILGLYPIYAFYLPGVLFGKSYPLTWMFPMHIFTPEGLIGVPTQVIGDYIIGYLIFAAILIASGAGDFFIKFALVTCGTFRGGPAKVSVVSSGFFGSISGSVIANVVATGSITIPMMKRLGFTPHYAGAIEACASTGGILMPPIMGTVAFVMAAFLGIEYRQVCIAAAIPAILYYFALIMQVDAYAARVGIKGIPCKDLPSIKETLQTGWPFLSVLLFLLWGLLYMGWETKTPFYASGLMLVLSLFRKDTMITPQSMIENIVEIGKLVAQTISIILPIGFIICGLTITGVSMAFTTGIVNIGGANVFLTLLLGGIACYILGMAGMMVAAYIFLAITMAPAVIQAGHLNVLSVHLFIIYYAMLAGITPPVALAAFVAASIAKADPIKTALQAMRLGIVIYFIPFFFIFKPALILQGSITETLYLFPLSLVGILFIVVGMEGYLWGFGKISAIARPIFVIAGFLVVFPEWITTITGAILALIGLAVVLIRKRAKGERLHMTES
jgi:TRAP transporter 4TM/12TM fusion protein